MWCGALQLNRRRRGRERELKIPRPVGAIQPYLDALAELSGILHGLPWLLAGGLAIPMTLGTFYRRHRDIDIVAPMEAMAALESAMAQAGYRLMRWFDVSMGGRGCQVLVPTSAGGLLMRMQPRKLKFVRRRGQADSPWSSLLSEIDVFPFRESGDFIQTCDYGYRLEKRVPVLGQRAFLEGGRDVPCFHLHYVDSLKSLRGGVIHRLDRAVMERGPSAACDWFGGAPDWNEGEIVSSAAGARAGLCAWTVPPLPRSSS